MSFGVFTGDLVAKSTSEHWDAVDADLKSIKLPIHIAPGNHDLEDRTLYHERYGPTYKSFVKNNDLFVFLDPSLDRWNISGEQLTFLKKATSEQEFRQIFIFTHQLIWWEPNNQYRKLEPNSVDGRSKSTNFWSEIEPLLSSKECPVYLVAGDVGAFPNGSEFGRFQRKNLNFIASGMGGGARDNVLLVTVSDTGKANFEVMLLGDPEPSSLGGLEILTPEKK